MKFIERELVRDLREKIDILNNVNPETKDLKLRHLRKRKNITNAQIHSHRIEHPECGLNFCVPRNRNKGMIHDNLVYLEGAYNWGMQNFNPATLNEDFIMGLSGHILPEIYPNKFAMYRDATARILGATTTPPSPVKIKNREMPCFVKSVKELLNGKDIINKIEVATYAHLHLVRIHPFVDGNGRTARALQDMILNYNGVPLPIIESGERYHYFNLLDAAVRDWTNLKQGDKTKHGATLGESGFYNFMAGKVNASLDKVLTGIR